MEIKILNDLYSDENTYFLIKNGECIVVDPGTGFDKIKSFSEDIEIKYIFLTHCHYDHISAVPEIISETGAKLCCTSECAENIKNSDINLTEFGLGRKLCIENVDIILKEEEVFDFNGEIITTIKTPGHTSCSTCFMFGDNLISGDTVFLRNVGRWDLPTGDGRQLVKTIKDKIFTLDENLNIYPGHGAKTSVGYEKKFNLFIK